MNTTESLELLAQGIKHLANRDNWIAYLKTQATFYTDSFNNVCLILQQCPHAVRVAGFHSWKKLDRSVKKGEKGIRILAPIVRKDPKDPETSAGISFKSVAFITLQHFGIDAGDYSFGDIAAWNADTADVESNRPAQAIRSQHPNSSRSDY